MVMESEYWPPSVHFYLLFLLFVSSCFISGNGKYVSIKKTLTDTLEHQKEATQLFKIFAVLAN